MAAGEWHTSEFESLTLAKGGVSAMPANKWSDDPFFNALTILRSHVKGCFECRHIEKYSAGHLTCITGQRLATRVIYELNETLRLKVAALHSAEQIFYPCPDVTKHGEGYALVARPMKAIGVQDGLF